MPLYRNLVSTEVSTNNKNTVLLIVLLYYYSSTVLGYAEIVVRRFPLPTPNQTLTSKQKGGHVLDQVRQRLQRLRQRSQKLADVIDCRYTMLSAHGVDDLTRSKHVRREVREVGAEGVLVGIAEAFQQNGGEGTFGKNEVVVLCCSHTVDVDRSRGIIASVIRGHNEGWAISLNSGLAGGHIDGVNEIHRHALIFFV